jgi:hypothetical protein
MAWLKDVIGYGTAAARPAAGSEGALYYETDTDTLFRDNGSTWDELTIGGGGDYVKIAEVSVGAGGSSSISFSSIAATYKHLRLVGQLRCDRADTYSDIRIRFNGDTGSNYDMSGMWTSNNTMNTGATNAGTFGIIGYSPAGNSPAGDAQAVDCAIPNYAGTTFRKNWISHTVGNQQDTLAGEQVQYYGGTWRSTAAINSITITPISGNWVQGSVLTLYGLT